MNTFAIQHSLGFADGGLGGLGDPGGPGGLGAEVDAVRAAAAAMTAIGLPVTVLHATYIPADRTWLCVVEADDAATVIEALRRAGTSTGRVLTAFVL